MNTKFPWGYLVPPLLALITAFGIVHHQSARHHAIADELREAKQEVQSLAKQLPKGESVPEHNEDNCKDEHHGH
jgi:hypothetical protein